MAAKKYRIAVPFDMGGVVEPVGAIIELEDDVARHHAGLIELVDAASEPVVSKVAPYATGE